MLKFALLLLVVFVSSLSATETCGTVRMMNYMQQSKEGKTLAKNSKLLMCPAEAYFDSVFTKTTAHFAIFYTTEGIHATTQAFVDSVAKSMEEAYALFTKENKTLAPKGFQTTYHFKKPVPNNLYPVEIADIGSVRDVESIGGFHGCFGLTLPSPRYSEYSEILIENDFQYSATGASIGVQKKDSIECRYYKPDAAMINKTYGYSYAQNFGAAIRITAFHELYHAVECRYLDINAYPTLWVEAASIAMEEIGAPDVDDYFSHLDDFFNMNWSSIEMISDHYSIAPLLISMYNSVDKTFDTKIWESYSKKPTEPFKTHFIAATNAFHKNADSLFHNFAERIYFSGKRFDQIKDNKNIKPLNGDQNLWPTISSFKNSIPPENHFYFSYQITKEYPLNVPGTISYILRKNDSVETIKINSQAEYSRHYLKIFEADSSILVYSNLDTKKFTNDSSHVSKFFAYPNPWKGNTPLCFTGLPDTQSIIEIRTRRGSLINNFEYSATEFCIAENEVKNLFAPGLYFYRAGRSGKTDKLIILY